MKGSVAIAPMPMPPGDHPLPGVVHLWQMYWPDHRPYLAPYARWLTASEQARAAQRHRQVDQQRFILSRGGLRGLLGLYLGIDPATVALAYGDRGKPFLANATPGLAFNLAHSGDWVVYGFTRGCAIGVDVEAIAPRAHLEGLIRRCLTPAEQAHIAEMGDSGADHAGSCDRRLRQFFAYWTVKEAYLKTTGQGLSYPMAAVEVGNMGDAPCFQQPDSARSWGLYPWQPDAQAVAAVCVAGALHTVALGTLAPALLHPSPPRST
jgi:4'-phosphopantetheinyl transferase